MSRKRSGADAPTVSLFPFLAVLLCTMGVLIVVLVVLVEHGRRQGEEARNTASAAVQDDLQFAEWKKETLRNALSAAQKDLEEANQQLAVIDSAVIAAEKEFASLEERAKNISELEQSPNSDVEALKREVAALSEQVETATGEAAKPTAEKKRRYAVVPYLGRHSTFRPPVYIECRADRIIIQPENIVLDETDFLGSLGPTNPLATVLRATREYLRTSSAPGSTESQLTEPYPLLLVRPDGIGAFYVAREALKSFGGQFGYELVEADWEIKFPKPDTQLAAAQQIALQDARERNRMLAQSAPSLYGDINESAFDAAIGEGSEETPGHAVGGVANKLGTSGAAMGAAGIGTSGGNTMAAADNSTNAVTGNGPVRSGPVGGALAGGGPTGGDYALVGENDMPSAGASASGAAESLAGGRLAKESGTTLGNSTRSFGGSASEGSFGGGEGAYTQSGGSPLSDVARSGQNGNNLGSGKEPGGGASNAMGNGNALAANTWEGSSGEEPSIDSSSPAGSAAAASGAPSQTVDNMNNAEVAQVNEDEVTPSNERKVEREAPQPPRKKQALAELDARCLARKLGRDWAIPKTARNAVAVSRPIRMECTAKGLRIAEPKGQQHALIPWQSDMENAAREVVEQAWKETEAWGSAGKGMQWRPVLVANVEPGGESKYRELEAALKASGIETQRNGVQPFFVRKPNSAQPLR